MRGQRAATRREASASTDTASVAVPRKRGRPSKKAAG